MELAQSNLASKDDLDKIKVLIADDDLPTRILLKAAISQWGYEISEASDGEEAWKMLQTKDAPNLLILDWIMPKLDGMVLCKRIKTELSYQPYIILLTQLTGTTNIIKGLEAGADEFLSKPFNMGELRSRLSVGVRLIKYEITLKKQNQQLVSYKKEVEKIISAIEETANPNPNPEQMQKLNFNIKKLIDLLRNFNLSPTKDFGCNEKRSN